MVKGRRIDNMKLGFDGYGLVGLSLLPYIFLFLLFLFILLYFNLFLLYFYLLLITFILL